MLTMATSLLTSQLVQLSFIDYLLCISVSVHAAYRPQVLLVYARVIAIEGFAAIVTGESRA